jgi:hypothetical protein
VDLAPIFLRLALHITKATAAHAICVSVSRQ